jgi:flagellar FliL protein
MAGNPVDKDDLDQPDEAVEAPKAPRRGRRLLLFAGAALTGLLLSLGGAYFAGLFDTLLGVDDTSTARDTVHEEPAATVFHQLPDLLVSLNTPDQRPLFLKVRITLELNEGADVARIDRLMPRIIDYCQVYLRELRPDDLQGSAGTERLREEILRRINAAAAPASIRDVLFSELLLQ